MITLHFILRLRFTRVHRILVQQNVRARGVAKPQLVPLTQFYGETNATSPTVVATSLNPLAIQIGAVRAVQIHNIRST